METLSFVLGIVFVVVIALAVVATYAFVKVIKVQRQIEDLDKRIAACLYEEVRQVHQRVDLFERDIYSQLDSRLDKLVGNLKKQKALI